MTTLARAQGLEGPARGGWPGWPGAVSPETLPSDRSRDMRLSSSIGSSLGIDGRKEGCSIVGWPPAQFVGYYSGFTPTSQEIPQFQP